MCVCVKHVFTSFSIISLYTYTQTRKQIIHKSKPKVATVNIFFSPWAWLHIHTHIYKHTPMITFFITLIFGSFSYHLLSVPHLFMFNKYVLFIILVYHLIISFKFSWKWLNLFLFSLILNNNILAVAKIYTLLIIIFLFYSMLNINIQSFKGLSSFMSLIPFFFSEHKS